RRRGTPAGRTAAGLVSSLGPPLVLVGWVESARPTVASRPVGLADSTHPTRLPDRDEVVVVEQGVDEPLAGAAPGPVLVEAPALRLSAEELHARRQLGRVGAAGQDVFERAGGERRRREAALAQPAGDPPGGLPDEVAGGQRQRLLRDDAGLPAVA